MQKNNTTPIYTGNRAIGYSTTNGGVTIKVNNEQAARRNGIIKGDVPTYAKCCGWQK
jgi:hypothetical protein